MRWYYHELYSGTSMLSSRWLRDHVARSWYQEFVFRFFPLQWGYFFDGKFQSRTSEIKRMSPGIWLLCTETRLPRAATTDFPPDQTSFWMFCVCSLSGRLRKKLLRRLKQMEERNFSFVVYETVPGSRKFVCRAKIRASFLFQYLSLY